MDDVVIGTVQARLVQRAAGCAGLRTADLWWEYFQLGGEAGELEVEAFLHRCLRLPGAQRDLLAHAANRLGHTTPASRVPYTAELAAFRGNAGRRGRDRAPDPGR